MGEIPAAGSQAQMQAHDDRMDVSDADHSHWVKRISKQFWFLFVLFTAAFVLLAWRTENNDQAIAQGLHDACMTRAATAVQYNEGREALITLLITAPRPTQRTPAEIEVIIEQLRDGLLLPIEDCGPSPSA
jgi:hypothetical protein